MPYLSATQIEQYQRDGFLVVRAYADAKEILALREAMEEIIAEVKPEGLPIFTTDNQTRHLDRYFLESGDKIRCFFEEEALQNGALQVAKERAINKVGHAMHDLHPVFEQFSYRPELRDIALSFGLREPAIVQSQYIFKQPHIGAQVNPHVDSTFIYTEPLSCLGAWVALEDARVDNGCLSFIPGSHRKYTLQQRYIRNETNTGTVFIDTTAPRQDWDTSQLQPVEVEAGDLVLLHGKVVHASYANRSAHSRHAYIMHLIDLQCHWPADNWLQRPPDFPFRSL